MLLQCRYKPREKEGRHSYCRSLPFALGGRHLAVSPDPCCIFQTTAPRQRRGEDTPLRTPFIHVHQSPCWRLLGQLGSRGPGPPLFPFLLPPFFGLRGGSCNTGERRKRARLFFRPSSLAVAACPYPRWVIVPKIETLRNCYCCTVE